MNYAYLLSEYGEHGSEEMVGSCDRDCLAALLEKNWPTVDGRVDAYVSQATAALKELLGKKTDEELAATKGGWNLRTGWGGIQLHVVPLCGVNRTA